MDLVTSATATRVFSSAHTTHIIRVTFSETPSYAISCPLEYQMHSSTGVRLLGDASGKGRGNIVCSWFVLEPKTHFCDCSSVGMTWAGMVVMVMVLSAVLTYWLL